MSDNRLITALDVHDFDAMKNLVDNLGDKVNFYKVGMELFYSVGEKSVKYLKERNKKVFRTPPPARYVPWRGWART